MIGNDIHGSNHTLPDAVGRTILQFNLVMRDGVIFAYSGYFLNTRRIRFQVWRTADVWTRKYSLVGETVVNPKTTYQKEDVSLMDI